MCPHCGADNSKVVETRRHLGSVYRRRKCGESDCGKSFISIESAPEGLRMPRELREESLARLHNADCRAAPMSLDVFRIFN